MEGQQGQRNTLDLIGYGVNKLHHGAGADDVRFDRDILGERLST